jgi:hypothetical protein
MNTLQKNALQLVRHERDRQDAKWGEQNHDPSYWLNILGEEYGEACKAFLDFSTRDLPDLKDYEKELSQVAAVAVAAIESLRRGKWNKRATQ